MKDFFPFLFDFFTMKKLYTYLLILLSVQLYSQSVTIKPDIYYHIFEGAGVSIGLYLGHHYSMNPTNQDKAMRWINKDLNMVYLQDYVATSVYPPLDANYFDKRADYFKAAKAYRSDVKISMTTNRFPKELVDEINVGGKVQPVLRTTDTAIYTKIAQFYFTLFQGFKDRGVDIDILNVVNEPDFDKKFYYGQSGETQKEVALIFSNAVPKFKEMLNDPTINISKMKIPLIMGVSTLDPSACTSYLKYFKQNNPKAWQQIDIVSTHQYNNGANVTMLNDVAAEAGIKPFFQSEMHTNRGDNLGTLPISDEHRGIISLANVFGSAVRAGASAWFFFQTNYPQAYTPAGLISADWQTTNPVPYRHYYAFKQLTTAQPPNSNMVERTVASFPNSDVLVFRKKEEDTIYAHVSNFQNATRSVTLNVEGKVGNNYTIKSYTVRVTDGVSNDEMSAPTLFQNPPKSLTHSLNPYSVNTFKIVLSKDLASSIKNTEGVLDDFNIVQTGGETYISSVSNQKIKSVLVHSMMGQMVSNQTNVESETAHIKVDNWTSGIYFFTIKTDKGSMVKRVFVGR
jgi:Secretion system C-terminal sorting domain